MDGPVAYDKRWRHAIKKEKVGNRSWQPPRHLEHIKTIPYRVQRGLGRPGPDDRISEGDNAIATLVDNTASAPSLLQYGQLPPSKQVTEEEQRFPTPAPKPIFSQTTPQFNNVDLMNPFATRAWLKPIPQRAARGMERAVLPERPIPMGLPRLPPKGRKWLVEAIEEPQADVLILGSRAGSARSSQRSAQGQKDQIRSLSAANLGALNEAIEEVVDMEDLPGPKGLKQEPPLYQSTLLRNLPHVAPQEGWQHPPQLLATVPTNKAAPEYQRFRATVQFQGRVNWVV